MNTIVRRIIGAVPVLLGISFLVFLLMHLAPGDPVMLLLGDDATPGEVARVRHAWGLDQPLLVQYWQFISRAVVGDFGRSLKFGEPVIKLIFERLPATIELASMSLLVAILISIPIGTYSAIKRDTLFDHAGTGVALIGVSLPNFWLGIMLIYFLGGQWNLLPVAGRIEYGIEIKPITKLFLVDSLLTANFGGFWSAVQHLLMPAVTLGTALAAIVTRITRSSVLEVMRQDYVTTARAKGLSEGVIIRRHILRNALITVVTILGLQLGALLNGSVITETVFSYPGIGDLLIQSISVRDYKLTQVLILFFGVIYFVVNLLVDMLYMLIDPRIKL
ncbi:MAG: ABC transporter permease [Deltaproteobacteria bacterium]|nr:ABC transporter permease [Deltaproteobacteria bacterium]MBI2180494.1 ABC transporter permease [Deltaproteobacteria bacterium]MBI2230739.1 ABC transporter permease [Deltaproteobacteria bacterium]MBI2368216.1 ABC transporter permease [Deltaproteobacteria bacterium]MBI2533483.1 ABC transporter permease [Deltaproteobacteria bacterium]